MVSNCLLFVIFLIDSTICSIWRSNYYIEEWIESSFLFPKSDFGMICIYNSTYSVDIITIIGGAINDKSVYQFNITSNSFDSISNLNENCCVRDPNSAVTISNNVYFTKGWDLNVNNFWIYDIRKNILIKRGNNNSKPAGNVHECYTTDSIENIYLIGGWNGTSSIKETYIYNINTQKWSNAPNLNIKRDRSACIYNRFNNIIYVFGGYDGYGSIELYDDTNNNKTSNKYIQLKNVTLTNKNAWGINAFMVKYSNTIFIVGSYNSFCNIYTINSQEISLCPGIDNNLRAYGHCGVLVENKPFNSRYYAFGLRANDGDTTNLIQYAMIAPKQYFIFNITSPINTQIIKILINNLHILDYSKSFNFDIIFYHHDNDTFIKYNNNGQINIILQNETTIKNCTICYVNNCNDCHHGIIPRNIFNYNFDKVYVEIKPIENSVNYVIFPQNKRLIILSHSAKRSGLKSITFTLFCGAVILFLFMYKYRKSMNGKEIKKEENDRNNNNNNNKEEKKEDEEDEAKEIGIWLEETVNLPSKFAIKYSNFIANDGWSVSSLDSITLHDLVRIGIDRSGHCQRIFKYTQKLSDDDKVKEYNIYSGLALIIGISDYVKSSLKEKKLSNLNGTRKDKYLLKNLFKKEYKYKTIHNKTDIVNYNDFIGLLNKTRNELNNNSVNYDSFIFAYSGHASQNVIYLSDGRYFDRIEIYKYFNGINCKGFASKPKLLIYDACRNIDNTSYKDSKSNLDELNRNSIDDKQHPDDNIIIFNANSDHYKAYDTDKGGLLFQSVNDVLMKNDKCISLDRMTKLIRIRMEQLAKQTNTMQTLANNQYGVKRDIYFYKLSKYQNIKSKGNDEYDKEDENQDFSEDTEIELFLNTILDEIGADLDNKTFDALDDEFDKYQNEINEYNLREIGDLKEISTKTLTSIITNKQHLKLIKSKLNQIDYI